MWKLWGAAFAAVALAHAEDEATLLQVNAEVDETFSFSELMKSTRGQAEMVVPAYLKHMATDAWVDSMKKTMNKESMAKFVDKHSQEIRKSSEGVFDQIKTMLGNSEIYRVIVKEWSKAMAELKDPEILQLLEKQRRSVMQNNLQKSFQHAWNNAPNATKNAGGFGPTLKHLESTSFIQEQATIPGTVPDKESAATLWCQYSVCKVETGWTVFTTGAVLYYPNTNSEATKYLEYVYLAPQTATRALYDPADESQTIKEFSQSKYRVKLRVESGWTFEPEYRAIDLALPWIYSHGMWLQQPNGWPVYVNRTREVNAWRTQDFQTKGLGALIEMSAGMRDQHYTTVSTNFRGGFDAVAPLKNQPSRTLPGDHFWDFQYTELAEPGHSVTSVLRGRESFLWNLGGVFWGFIYDSTKDNEVDPEEDMM